MVALKTERRVYQWHVVPRPFPKGVNATVTLTEVLGILKGYYAEQTTVLYMDEAGRILAADTPPADLDPRNRVYIADIAETNSTFSLLLNRGDPFVANTAYINTSNKVRTDEPKEDEAQGWSAHLVIAKAETGGIHRACFERMQHMSSTHAETLIRVLMERFAENNAKYTVEKEFKRGNKVWTEQRTYRPGLEIRKIRSESLRNDIRNGRISAITLITENGDYDGPDKPVVESVEYKLKIKPRKAAPDKLDIFLDNLKVWAKKQGFTHVQFDVLKDGSTKRPPRIEIEKEDALETLYVSTKTMSGFSSELERCYAKICSDITDEMVKIIKSNSGW
jgi:hypothetical protein